MKKCLNVVFSLLLLFLVGLGITSCEPEAPKVYEDDFFYKVINSTEFPLELRCQVKFKEAGEEIIAKETDYVTIEPGASHIFAFCSKGIEDCYVHLQFKNGYYGWTQYVISDLTRETEFFDAGNLNDCSTKATIKAIPLAEYVDNSSCVYVNEITNTTGEYLYVYSFMAPKQDEWDWSYSYRTDWVKLAPGETVQFKYDRISNYDGYTHGCIAMLEGTFGCSVFYKNDFSASSWSEKKWCVDVKLKSDGKLGFTSQNKVL